MESATHTYARNLLTDRRSSLSVVASYVPAHSRVLDIGTGTGALGQYLTQQKSCTVDGITHSQQEADIANKYYHALKVLDLEADDWHACFRNQLYDCIVCADVLEHIKDPRRVIRDCRDLLSDSGLFLISIPNISYAYFIAELMKGEFAYGTEGLLDNTHLRFFTRRSFERLLTDENWFSSACEPIHQPWFETEFRLRIDDLPPNVGAYILAQPDAGVYQWVFAVRKTLHMHASATAALIARNFSPATFLAQVYVTTQNGFQAENPINALGNIGEAYQAIEFRIPADFGTIVGIRLDVADRTGFMRISSVEGINDRGEQVFEFGPKELKQALASNEHHHLVDITPNGTSDALWLKLTGDDPHFHLPLPSAGVEQWLGEGRLLRLWCTWPWSADYEVACSKHLPAVNAPVPAVSASQQATWLDRLGHAVRLLLSGPVSKPAPAEAVTEVVVPVFNSLHFTRRCLESVLASRNEQPLHVTVINDTSTDPEVRPWLKFFASQHPELTIIENAVNLGFVKTVNLGMRMAGQRDVILLNSDTQVSHHWLDRLRATALASPKVASVTPFSNNATICSFPDFCTDNPFPDPATLEYINSVAGKMFQRQAVTIPTAVGFCMYIKRLAWAEVGDFDAATFGLGYGEENDWCMRAASAGWTHEHALDVYVAHQGGASFSDKRQALQASALKNLLELHPDYNEKVQAYVKADPARTCREALALALNAGRASGTSAS